MRICSQCDRRRMNSDSVMPIRALHAKSMKGELAKAVSAVTPFHSTKLRTTNLRFENRSPIWPAIGKQMAYTHKKIDPVKPN